MKGGNGLEEKENKIDDNKEIEDTSNEVELEIEETKTSLDEKELEKINKEREEEKEEEYKKKIDELTDKLMRQMAEFDNYRKRTEKEKSSMFDLGAKLVIEKILPIIDNFERGLAVLSEEEKEEAFASGIDKVYKQLMQTLTELGVSKIEAVGIEFNPELHNAVMHSEDENFGENIVSEELQKGYMYKDTVVRPSMVKVVN